MATLIPRACRDLLADPEPAAADLAANAELRGRVPALLANRSSSRAASALADTGGARGRAGRVRSAAVDGHAAGADVAAIGARAARDQLVEAGALAAIVGHAGVASRAVTGRPGIGRGVAPRLACIGRGVGRPIGRGTVPHPRADAAGRLPAVAACVRGLDRCRDSGVALALRWRRRRRRRAAAPGREHGSPGEQQAARGEVHADPSRDCAPALPGAHASSLPRGLAPSVTGPAGTSARARPEERKTGRDGPPTPSGAPFPLSSKDRPYQKIATVPERTFKALEPPTPPHHQIFP